jgi:hypothetical protein
MGYGLLRMLSQVWRAHHFDNVQGLNRLNIVLFTPCLLFSKVAFTLSAGKHHIVKLFDIPGFSPSSFQILRPHGRVLPLLFISVWSF